MLDLRRLRLLRELHARGTIASVADALSYSPFDRLPPARRVPARGRVCCCSNATAAGCASPRRRASSYATPTPCSPAWNAPRPRWRPRRASWPAPYASRRSRRRRSASSRRHWRAWRDRHPGLRLEVTEAEPDEAFDALLRRECDVAICDEYGGQRRPRPRGLTFEELYAERVRLVLPRDHPAATLGELAGAAWAGGHPGTSHERLLDQACTTSIGGFTPDIRHRATDLLVLLALVARGGAVTPLPDLSRPERDPSVAVRDIGIARRLP